MMELPLNCTQQNLGYHYTSLQALFEIIRTQTLRLTNFSSSNDRKELQYDRHVYGFAAESAVNLNSPDCILPDLIDRYEETSFYCAADDEFYAYIALYDDAETSKWQYSINMVLSKIHREYAKRIYVPNRYMDKAGFVRKPDAKATPCYVVTFYCEKGNGWHSFGHLIKDVPYDVALASEMQLFCAEVCRDMNKHITTGRFVSENLKGIQIGHRGSFTSFVDKRYGIYQLNISADKPFEFKAVVFQKEK